MRQLFLKFFHNFGKVHYGTVLKKERSYNANLFGLHQSAIMITGLAKYTF